MADNGPLFCWALLKCPGCKKGPPGGREKLLMAEKFISDRNLKFMLYEMFNLESLLKYPRYADHSWEVFDMILDTALKLAKDVFKPLFTEMDRNAPEYVNGEVKVHPDMKKVMREAGEGGWISATFPYEVGGRRAGDDFHVRNEHLSGRQLFCIRLSGPDGRGSGAHRLIWYKGDD